MNLLDFSSLCSLLKTGLLRFAFAFAFSVLYLPYLLSFVYLYAQGIDDNNSGARKNKMEPWAQLQSLNARIQG